MNSDTAERWRRELDGWAPADITVGVIGDPVRHSLSPRLHQAAFEAMGINGRSLPFEVPEGDAPSALDAMRSLGILGLSVTMPHKEAVVALADGVTATVAALNAANCLVNQSGHVSAHNTDGDGLVRSLHEEASFDPAGRRVVVLGAGGAARSVIEALGRSQVADLAVVNRNQVRAQTAVLVGGPAARVGQLDDVDDAELVINATPVGMDGRPGLPTPAESLHAGQTVVDLVYQPLVTDWLEKAEQAKASVMNGVPMLLHQAAIQIELWTGQPAPVAAMRTAVAAHMTPPGAAPG